MNGGLACTLVVDPDEIPSTSAFQEERLSQTIQRTLDVKLIDGCYQALNKLREKFSMSKTTTESSGPPGVKTIQTEEPLPASMEGGYVQMEQIERLMRKDVVTRECPTAYKLLEEIRQLKPDWDTYGAPSLSGDIIDLAYSVVFDIKRTAEAMGRRFPEPFIVPGPDGSIQLEWQFGDKEFELEIMMSNQQPRYAYLLCPRSAISTWEEGEFTISPYEHPAINSFLSWI